MDTNRLQVESKQTYSTSSHSLCSVVPQDLFRYASVYDIAGSCGNISFRLPADTTVHTIWPMILACMCAASFHFGGGTVLGFSAILIPQLEAPDSDIKVNKSDISWIASVVALVIPVGALFTGWLVDRLGRIRTLIVATVPFAAGWACIALAHDLPTLLLGRVLTAIAMAMGTSPAVVYITEIAPPDLRGTLICMGPALVSLGMVVTYALGAYLHWRTIGWLTISCCLVPILLISLWAPESPVWLVSKGRSQKALSSIKYLLRKDKKTGLAESQMAELLREHTARKSRADQQGSALVVLCRSLAKPTGYKPLLLLSMIFAFQQLAGIYITIFYAVSFFQDMGATIDPYVSSVGIGVVRLSIGILTAFLLKSYGRRPLFMISGIGMAVFVFISGYLTKEVAEGRQEPSFIPVICILLYMSVGVIGFLSIPWTMTAELFAIDIRGMAQGLTLSIAHLIMFAAIKIYPFLTDMLGGVYAVQWMFAGASASAVVFVFLFLPETHRKELTEIQDYFKNNTFYILSKKTNRRNNRLDSVQINVVEAEKLKEDD